MCPLPQKPVFSYSWQHIPNESQIKPMYFKYKHGNNMGGEITPNQKKIIIFCCLSGLWPGLVDKQDAFFEKLGPYILATLHRVCAIVTGTLHTLFCSQ